MANSFSGSLLISERSPDTLEWLNPTDLSRSVSQRSIFHSSHSDVSDTPGTTPGTGFAYIILCSWGCHFLSLESLLHPTSHLDVALLI